jgi:hypothetical protein
VHELYGGERENRETKRKQCVVVLEVFTEEERFKATGKNIGIA